MERELELAEVTGSTIFAQFSSTVREERVRHQLVVRRIGRTVESLVAVVNFENYSPGRFLQRSCAAGISHYFAQYECL